MFKSKKTILIILITVFILIIMVLVALFFLPKIKQAKDNKKQEQVNDNNSISVDNEFLNYFTDINYSEQTQEIISTVYELTKSEENKYEVDVHLPKINLNSCVDINNEIMQIFGSKLLKIIKSNEVYTKYNVDYITFTNNSVISLIIKATLKEGDTPQRVMVQTYNYDLNAEKLVSFEELLTNKNLDKQKIQEIIYSTVKSKNLNSETLSNQGYNIYVRDLTSKDYKIENIKNYYLNKDGNLFIVFAYGNNNYTGTLDIINVTK